MNSIREFSSRVFASLFASFNSRVFARQTVDFTLNALELYDYVYSRGYLRAFASDFLVSIRECTPLEGVLHMKPALKGHKRCHVWPDILKGDGPQVGSPLNGTRLAHAVRTKIFPTNVKIPIL